MQTSVNAVWYCQETPIHYIPIDVVVNSLLKHSAANLLPFHALTGCDNTSYFANYIKKSSWKVFKEHHQLLQNLGIGGLTQETIRSTEAFVCRIYDVQTDLVMLQGTYSSQELGNQRPCHQPVMSCAFISCVCIVKQWCREMPIVPYLSFLRPRTWDASTLNQG